LLSAEALAEVLSGFMPGRLKICGAAKRHDNDGIIIGLMRGKVVLVSGAVSLGTEDGDVDLDEKDSLGDGERMMVAFFVSTGGVESRDDVVFFLFPRLMVRRV